MPTDPDIDTQQMDKSLDDIAELVGGSVSGEGSIRITGLNGLQDAAGGDLTFLGNPRFESFMETTKAAAVIVPKDFGNNGKPLIHVKHPYLAFAILLKEYERETKIHPEGIHRLAVIAENVRLGRNVSIDALVRLEDGCEIGDDVILYSGVYIGRGSKIGSGTIVYPNATIRERVVVGANCVIHSNAAIGSDGFGFTLVDNARVKIPQVGTVRIGDDVEIGSNTSIDRSTTGCTVIGNGTKIDNLVQIAHNVVIGAHCTISAETGIAGSTTIGNHVMIGGQVGIGGHLEIGDNVRIGAKTGVSKSVPPGTSILGTPFRDLPTTRRIWASLPYLPNVLRRIRALEKRVGKKD